MVKALFIATISSCEGAGSAPHHLGASAEILVNVLRKSERSRWNHKRSPGAMATGRWGHGERKQRAHGRGGIHYATLVAGFIGRHGER